MTMRQIKFRGKRTDNGEWIYGDLLTFNGTESEITDWKTVDCSRYDVDPETVGQFTGLFDKNGTEIYEGDILGRYTDSGEIVALSVVLYTDNGFFAQSLVSGTAYNFDLERILERQNVVGNIHDNLELL